MQLQQKKWTEQAGWETLTGSEFKTVAQLVLVFGGVKRVSKPNVFKSIKAMYPEAHIVIGSTAGEILSDEMLEDSIVLTAFAFAQTKLVVAQTEITLATESEQAGARLAKQLDGEDLVHVMVFSDGLKVNGTGFVAGLTKILPEGVSVTGGLMGGGNDFKVTYLGLDEQPSEGKLVAIGFYGKNLHVSYGSLGGWDSFGPEREITKATGNVLYELDHKPALQLYKDYLGDKAKDLPGSGLLFPLNLKLQDDDVVRTLLAVNEADQSMTFAGDMPVGIKAQLMRANFERLIDGASSAAKLSVVGLASGRAEFALLISCIGRKLVLKERIVEELEAVRGILGPQAVMLGFYSYGEICPTASIEHRCRLHNQTMTVTTLREEV